MKRCVWGLASLLAVGYAGTGLADDLRKTEQFSGTHIGFAFAVPYSNVTLTVTGPNDFEAKAYSKSGAPAIDLKEFGTVPDGNYSYQMTASDGVANRAPAELYNGRPVEAGLRLQSVSTSGTFVVKGGAIVPRGHVPKAARRDLP